MAYVAEEYSLLPYLCLTTHSRKQHSSRMSDNEVEQYLELLALVDNVLLGTQASALNSPSFLS